MANHSIPTPSRPKQSFIQHMLAHIELADPVTWISPITVVVCGAVAAGRGEPGFQFSSTSDVLLMLLGVLMFGPLATGFSQSINDYFDRDLDAINDPSRPIPSGRITLGEARINWLILGLATFAISLYLAQRSVWIPILAICGLILAVAYSIPPIKLKKTYWFGAPAVGIGYVSIIWIASHLMFAPLSWPSLLLALINSCVATGLIFLNDIKSIEGDRKLGLNSLTVALGARRTITVAFSVIGLSMVSLLILALVGGYYWAAGLVVLTILIPIYWQIRLYRQTTHRNFQNYMLVSNPLIIMLQFVSAFIVGGYFGK